MNIREAWTRNIALEAIAALAVHDPGRQFPRMHLDVLLGVLPTTPEAGRPIAVSDWLRDVLTNGIPHMSAEGERLMKTAETLADHYARYALGVHAE
ncbi:hypothetical protein [Streptomyces sp. KR55]|uniref:hypothetical protein n=1 Tax=Streptomyces sp. KR55 TaxID=3457425 RepID=UPI003FCF393C